MPANGSGGSPGYKAPPVAAPSLPEWLGDEARAEWDRIVPLLIQMEMLSEVDQVCLAAYCQATAELVIATRVLSEEGRFVTEVVQNSKGEIVGERKKPHPALTAQRDAMGRVKAYLSEFGLTPAARARLRVLKDGGPDALSALLAGQPIPQ
jgi:P27 family predicted phage terminase small subunit